MASRERPFADTLEPGQASRIQVVATWSRFRAAVDRAAFTRWNGIQRRSRLARSVARGGCTSTDEAHNANCAPHRPHTVNPGIFSN